MIAFEFFVVVLAFFLVLIPLVVMAGLLLAWLVDETIDVVKELLRSGLG